MPPDVSNLPMSCQVPFLEVLSIKVSQLNGYEDACDAVARAVRNRERCFCVAINPEKVERAASDPVLRRLLNSAQLQIADGIGVVWAARVLRGRRIARITGVEMFSKLIERASNTGWRVYLLGASPEANREASCILQARYPTLNICGAMDGYFADEQEAVSAINAAQPDLLFVALGSPRQERWICRNWESLHVPFLMGVGGTYDVISGRVRRAPQWCRKLGVEWLYRLVTQPSRWRRQLALPRFAARVAWEKCRPRRNASPMHANFD